MSKVVKKVRRGIKKVVKGIRKGVSKVWKKIKNSKILKVVATAALVYFGGAALMGAMGGASAGTGFMGSLSGAFKGAVAGVKGAWAGVTGAASAAAGGNFAAAGQSLSGGITGAYGAGAGAVAPAAASAATPLMTPAGNAIPGTTDFAASAAQSTSAANSALAKAGMEPLTSTIGSSTNVLGSSAANLGGGAGGLLQGAGQKAAEGGFWSSTGGAAAIMTGGQMLSGYAQGRAQEDMYRREQALREEELERYGLNIGSYIPQVRWNPETRQYEVMESGTPSGATDFVGQSVGSTNAANRALYQAGLDPIRSSFESSYPNFGPRAQGVLG